MRNGGFDFDAAASVWDDGPGSLRWRKSRSHRFIGSWPATAPRHARVRHLNGMVAPAGLISQIPLRRVSKRTPGERGMCRNIKTLFNFDPPATDQEIRGASLQFVRKLSGFNKPSKANEAAFNRAVEQAAAVARSLLDSLVTNAAPRDRAVEAARARARATARFGQAALHPRSRATRRGSPRIEKKRPQKRPALRLPTPRA